MLLYLSVPNRNMVSFDEQDNLSDVLLKDKPEKYKYNPYAMYSEDVLRSCIHKNR